MARDIDDVIKALDCFTTKQHPCLNCPFNPVPPWIWVYGCIRGQCDLIAEAKDMLKELKKRRAKGK